MSKSKPDDFSVELKALREKSGLSLEDLFKRTRINRSFLEALESGNFKVLPEAYVRLFLKKYAQEIGLSTGEILSRYEACLSPPPPSPDPVLVSTKEKSRRISPVLVVIAGIVVAAGIGGIALKGGELWPQRPALLDEEITTRDAADVSGKSSPSLSSPRSRSETHTVPQDRVVSAYSFSTDIPTNFEDTALNLGVEALSRTSALVFADDRVVFEGMLPAGDTRSWSALNRFRIEVGEADALRFSLQGHPLKQIGRPGHKLRLQISRKSVWVEEVLPSTSTSPNPSENL